MTTPPFTAILAHDESGLLRPISGAVKEDVNPACLSHVTDTLTSCARSVPLARLKRQLHALLVDLAPSSIHVLLLRSFFASSSPSGCIIGLFAPYRPPHTAPSSYHLGSLGHLGHPHPGHPPVPHHTLVQKSRQPGKPPPPNPPPPAATTTRRAAGTLQVSSAGAEKPNAGATPAMTVTQNRLQNLPSPPRNLPNLQRNPHRLIPSPPGFHGKCRETRQFPVLDPTATSPATRHRTRLFPQRTPRASAGPPAPSRPRLPTRVSHAPIPSSAAAGTVRAVWRCVVPASLGFSPSPTTSPRILLRPTDTQQLNCAVYQLQSPAFSPLFLSFYTASSSCFIGGALGRIPARIPTRKCDFNGSPAALFAPQRSSAVDRLHHAPVHGSQLSAPSLSLFLLYPFAPYSYPATPSAVPLHRPLRRTRRSYNDGPSLTPHRLHGRAALKSVVATGLYLLESPRTADLTRARLSIMLTEAGASDPQDGDEQQGGPLNGLPWISKIPA
ncbi:hypothetical protein C8J57DRAFT_1530091 [Mycena rebaudengoi]|nr:hypothetical protein C8J57DRAFT_1530091 [Mycena rebaudengoi]